MKFKQSFTRKKSSVHLHPLQFAQNGPETTVSGKFTMREGTQATQREDRTPPHTQKGKTPKKTKNMDKSLHIPYNNMIVNNNNRNSF